MIISALSAIGWRASIPSGAELYFACFRSPPHVSASIGDIWLILIDIIEEMRLLTLYEIFRHFHKILAHPHAHIHASLNFFQVFKCLHYPPSPRLSIPITLSAADISLQDKLFITPSPPHTRLVHYGMSLKGTFAILAKTLSFDIFEAISFMIISP